MAYKIIPLTPDPDQTFSCTIPVDSKNVSLFFRFRHNTIAGYWVATITNATTGNTLIDSLPVLTGEYPAADLLVQYQHLSVGSAFLVNRSNDAIDTPSDANLGSDYVLAWGDAWRGLNV